MKKLFILMSHPLTDDQELAARAMNLGEFIKISDDGWSDIDPSLKSIQSLIQPYKDRLQKEAKSGDYLLVQGDFGATYSMVNFAKNLGIIPIYATTRRVVTEETIEGKVITKREFKHQIFREYE